MFVQSRAILRTKPARLKHLAMVVLNCDRCQGDSCPVVAAQALHGSMNTRFDNGATRERTSRLIDLPQVRFFFFFFFFFFEGEGFFWASHPVSPPPLHPLCVQIRLTLWTKRLCQCLRAMIALAALTVRPCAAISILMFSPTSLLTPLLCDMSSFSMLLYCLIRRARLWQNH